MTVKELIEELQQYPEDTVVMISMHLGDCSETSVITIEDEYILSLKKITLI